MRTALAQTGADRLWPTLVVNLSGAFVLGFVVRYGRRHWPTWVLAALGVGFLGALTTFSTLAGELWDQLAAHDWDALGLYATASVAGGWVAAAAGLRLGQALR